MLELGLESGSFRAATAQRSQNFEAKAGVRRTARKAAPGEMLIMEGERSSGLYLVAAGQCAVLQGGGVIAELGPGELFGELSLLRRAPAVATICTASKCYLLHLPRETFSELILTHPQVLEYVGEVTQSRRSLQLL